MPCPGATVARSRDHRWMVIAYILAGLFFLILLPLRRYGAPADPQEVGAPHATLSFATRVVDLQLKVTQPAELSEAMCLASLQQTAVEVDL